MAIPRGVGASITKGIVLRIEFAGYNEGLSGVRVQIDAAINPGNSGGPALIDGKMVGLIFSKLTQADNIGYIIPSEEIDLFLKDVADGAYDGKPAMHERFRRWKTTPCEPFSAWIRKRRAWSFTPAIQATHKIP